MFFSASHFRRDPFRGRTPVKPIPFPLLLLAIPALAHAQDRELVSRPLRGVRKMCVAVESLHPSATAVGLTVEGLQAAVEQRLRQLGITVISSKSCAPSPWLYLRVTTRQGSDGGFFASLELSFHDGVRLVRDSTVNISAATWMSAGRAGYVAANESAQLIRDAVNDLMGEFASDYVSANPKRLPPP